MCVGMCACVVWGVRRMSSAMGMCVLVCVHMVGSLSVCQLAQCVVYTSIAVSKCWCCLYARDIYRAEVRLCNKTKATVKIHQV